MGYAFCFGFSGLIREVRDLEPLTSSMRSQNPELPYLLNLWEALDFTL